jgi:hypothetical protein
MKINTENLDIVTIGSVEYFGEVSSDGSMNSVKSGYQLNGKESDKEVAKAFIHANLVGDAIDMSFSAQQSFVGSARTRLIVPLVSMYVSRMPEAERRAQGLAISTALDDLVQ